MDLFVKLCYDSLKYYIENKKVLDVYDDRLRKDRHGIIVRIENKDRLKGQCGSIYPTRKDMGLDIIHESINAGFFSYTYKPINLDNLYDHKITVYEFYDVKQIKYVEDFGDYDGICISFNDDFFIFYRKDFDSDLAMFETAIKEANLDPWDIFLIEKFKLKLHSSSQ